MEDDVGDGVETVRRQVLRRADEVARGVVDEPGERAAFVPDLLHHRIDRRSVADVDRVRAHAAAVLGHQFLGGVFEHWPAAPGEPELRAELEILRGDLFAETGAAAGDEDALTLEEVFLEHARSAGGERAF